MNPENSKRKVAILGGGAGAMSTAFWLSATPELRSRFEITVYTQGHRLGGKGASGRNAAQGQRIEEHGLHVMMGFYETVFATLRACYRFMPMPEVNPAFPNWQEAFRPQFDVTLWTGPHFVDLIKRDWHPWTFTLPHRPGLPGDGPLVVRHDVHHMNTGIKSFLQHWVDGPLTRLLTRHENDSKWSNELRDSYRSMCAAVLQAIENNVDFFIDGIRNKFIAELEKWQHWFQQHVSPLLKGLAALSPGEMGVDAYRLLVMCELGFAGSIGFLKDVVPYRMQGFERINQFDFVDWLKANGADETAAWSPVTKCLYDLGFAYEEGKAGQKHAKLAAGAVVYTALHMAFLYKGAPLYRMNAGMGDIIFTPLYTLLAANGVKFKFFSRVTKLAVNPGEQPSISRIQIEQQAQIKHEPYQPLRPLTFDDGKNWDCWPSAPDWNQLENGDELAAAHTDFDSSTQKAPAAALLSLECGKDFDDVVLAIPPAAAAQLSEELEDTTLAGESAGTAWRNMLRNTNSVATQSAQRWFSSSLEQLGWTSGPAISTTYANALNSWATMDQVLPAECWSQDGAASAPKGLEYYCGCLPNPPLTPRPDVISPQYVVAITQHVKQSFDSWMQKNQAAILPKARAFVEAQQSPETGSSGDVYSDYFRANVEYSELYVQSFPGTIKYRLAPGNSGFSNLYLAGDWTLTSINGGCAEAAFQSGMHAACAIGGLQLPPEPDFPLPPDRSSQ